MSAPHERMPVILELEAWPRWLGKAGGETTALMQPAPDDVGASLAGKLRRQQRAQQWLRAVRPD